MKHSSYCSFAYSDFTPDLTSLSALHNMAAEQLHSLLVERWFLGHPFVVKALNSIWYSFEDFWA